MQVVVAWMQTNLSRTQTEERRMQANLRRTGLEERRIQTHLSWMRVEEGRMRADPGRVQLEEGRMQAENLFGQTDRLGLRVNRPCYQLLGSRSQDRGCRGTTASNSSSGEAPIRLL